MPSYSDLKCLQKVNVKCPQIFVPWKITFDPLSKDTYERSKKKFPSEIWGHFAFTFCWYFKSEYEGIYLLQVLSIRIWGHLPSAGTFNQNLRVFTFWGYLHRAMTVYFWDEVFSLKKCLYMPLNNNSVCRYKIIDLSYFFIITPIIHDWSYPGTWNLLIIMIIISVSPVTHIFWRWIHFRWMNKIVVHVLGLVSST